MSAFDPKRTFDETLISPRTVNCKVARMVCRRSRSPQASDRHDPRADCSWCPRTTLDRYCQPQGYLANQITETDADWLVPRAIREPMSAFGTKRTFDETLISPRTVNCKVARIVCC